MEAINGYSPQQQGRQPVAVMKYNVPVPHQSPPTHLSPAPHNNYYSPSPHQQHYNPYSERPYSALVQKPHLQQPQHYFPPPGAGGRQNSHQIPGHNGLHDHRTPVKRDYTPQEKRHLEYTPAKRQIPKQYPGQPNYYPSRELTPPHRARRHTPPPTPPPKSPRGQHTPRHTPKQNPLPLQFHQPQPIVQQPKIPVAHSPRPTTPDRTSPHKDYNPATLYGMGNSNYYTKFYENQYYQTQKISHQFYSQTVLFDDSQPYTNVTYRKMPPAGGQTLGDKVNHSEVSEFGRIWKELAKSPPGTKFEDQNFLPTKESLIGDVYTGYTFDPTRVRWARPEEFLKGMSIKVFDKIEVNDICQGELGDCYFLSSLASISEHPNRIERLFVTKEVNSYGIYCVWLCIRGEWREIIIDDRFPVIEVRGMTVPAFSRAKGGELWVLILEKVWAKIHGSYAKIEAGISREALHELTGAPTRPLFMDNPNVYQEIKDAYRRGWVMTAGSNLKASRVGDVKTGLLSQHSYSILNYVEIDTPKGRLQLLRMRNPWGDFEWAGDWSDKSPLWTPELRRAAGAMDIRDGIFFMSFADFQAYFHDMQICMVESTFKYSAIRVRSTFEEDCYFSVKVEKEGEYFFTINQESRRKFPSTSNYDYSTVKLLLAARQDTPTGQNGATRIEVKPISGVCKAEMEVWTSGRIPPGDYILYAKIEWKLPGVQECTLSSSGPEEVHFKRMVKPPHFHDQYFKQVALNNSKKRTPLTSSGITRYHDITQQGYGYWYYTNPSQTMSLEEEIILLNPSGIGFLPPNSPTKASVIVPPGGDALVLAGVGADGYQCTVSYRTKIKQ